MITPLTSFDFTTANLDSRITFTRTTGASNPATFVNSSGVLASATNNQPRFDYDPSTLVCKGLLIEESRQNRVRWSNNFSNAVWNDGTPNNATVATGQISPDGTTNGATLTAATGGVNSMRRQAITAPGATTYTVSFYVKKGTSTSSRILVRDNTNSINFIQTLALTWSGSVPVLGSLTGTWSSVNAGNGWYRVIGSGATGAGASVSITVGIFPDNVAGTGTLLVYGAQLEAGAFATSYIPTTTAVLTRNPDVATITGTNFSDWWQAGSGGALVRAQPGTVDGTRPWVQFDDGTVNEIIALRGNSTNPELYIVDGGSPQAQIDAGTIAANTAYNLTGWWQTNNCAARLNLTAPVFDTSATIPTVTQMRIGNDGANYMNGHLASISYYDTLTSYIYTRRKNKVVFSVI